MQQIQKDYAARNDVNLLLFPCNQFLHQEPDENAKIKAFASQYLNLTSGSVTLFSKTGCNSRCTTAGSDQCVPSSKNCCTANNPIYTYLKSIVSGDLSWNFNKFLVGKDGVPVSPRYGDDIYTEKLEEAINKLL